MNLIFQIKFYTYLLKIFEDKFVLFDKIQNTKKNQIKYFK